VYETIVRERIFLATYACHRVSFDLGWSVPVDQELRDLQTTRPGGKWKRSLGAPRDELVCEHTQDIT
jgi:hypothetical protein